MSSAYTQSSSTYWYMIQEYMFGLPMEREKDTNFLCNHRVKQYTYHIAHTLYPNYYRHVSNSTLSAQEINASGTLMRPAPLLSVNGDT